MRPKLVRRTPQGIASGFSPRPWLTTRCMWDIVFAETCFEFFHSFDLLNIVL
jgi:hypothetical protein